MGKSGITASILAVLMFVNTGAAQTTARFGNFQNFGGDLHHELAVRVRVQVPGAGIFDVVAAQPYSTRPLSAFRYQDIQAPNSDHFNNVSALLLPNQNLQPTDGILDLKAGDINLDGFDDLVLLRSFPTQGSYISVALWDPGSQEYAAEQQIAQGTFEVMQIADVNQDGFVDILVLDGTAGWGAGPATLDVGLFASNLGSFPTVPNVVAQIPNTVSGVIKLEAGDTDGDNDVDLIVQASILTGTFSAPGTILSIDQTVNGFVLSGAIASSATGSSFFDLTIEDIDQNGVSEVAASTVSQTGYSVLRFSRQSGAWTTTPIVPFTAANRPGLSLEFSDYNNDGRKDLIAVSASTGILVYTQTATGAFINSTATVLSGVSGLVRSSSALLVADFNLDGFQDILVPHSAVGATFLLGNGTSFREATLYHGIYNRYSEFHVGPIIKACSGKITSNFEDLVLTHQTGAFLARGDGTGDFSAISAVTPTTGLFTTCAVLDSDADGDLDIFMASETDPSVFTPSPDENYILVNNGGTFTKNLVVIPQQPTGRIVTASAKANLNGDNRDDLVLITTDPSRSNFQLQIYINTTQGFQLIQPAVPANHTALALEVGDFNGDGLQEPVVAHTDGLGSFSQDIFYSTGVTYSPTTVATLNREQLVVADFNGDGMDDLLMMSANPLNTPAMYSANPAYSPTLPAVSSYSSHAFDANGDGVKDIAIFAPRFNGATLQYLINSGGVFTIAAGNIDSPLPVVGMEMLDLDADDDLDIVSFDFDDRYLDGYSQPRAILNMSSQLIATRAVRVGGPNSVNISIDVGSSLPGGIVAVFASLDPLTSGIPTPFGVVRLINFGSGPVLALAGPMSLAQTVATLPPTPAAAGQAMTLQGLILSPTGTLKLTNPQVVELLP